MSYYSPAINHFLQEQNSQQLCINYRLPLHQQKKRLQNNKW